MRRKIVGMLSVFTVGCALYSNPVLAETINNSEVATEQPVNATSEIANKIESYAKTYMGLPYIFGGENPKIGLDCSSFTRHVLKGVGINLPRTAAEQFEKGKGILTNELQKGDLVFFETYKKGASHVGIYLENGNFIHEGGTKVHIANLNNPYYKQRYLGARRFISNSQTVTPFTAPEVTNDELPISSNTKPKKIEEMPKSFNVTPNGIKAKYPITIGDNLVREGNVYISKSESKNTSDSTNTDENDLNSGEQIEDKSGIDSTNVMEKIEEKLPKEKKEEVQGQPETTITLFNHGEQTYLPHQKFELTSIGTELKMKKEEMAVILSSLINNTKDKPLQKIPSILVKDVFSKDPYYESIIFILSHNLMLPINKQFEPKKTFSKEDANILLQNLMSHPYFKINSTDLDYIKKNENDKDYAFKYFQSLSRAILMDSRQSAEQKIKNNIPLQPIEKLSILKLK
ncbi:C40 family peptidase [Bacillus cereus group sp. BceL078]|uniref:C40 family peptidase n=1 Tax=Bacillus cereus group sp. BceL078 TaxID=3445150 RepID=UPI003F22F7AE